MAVDDEAEPVNTDILKRLPLARKDSGGVLLEFLKRSDTIKNGPFARPVIDASLLPPDHSSEMLEKDSLDFLKTIVHSEVNLQVEQAKKDQL
jgi:hypothetical protein